MPAFALTPPPPPPPPPPWEERLSRRFFATFAPRLMHPAHVEPPASLAPFADVAVARRKGRGPLSATWYETAGARGAVLLLHPWVGWGRAYFHRGGRIEALRAAGYHAMALDLAGFGESGPPVGFHHHDVEAGLAFLRARAPGLPLHVWGISGGGYWAHPVLSRDGGVAGAMFEEQAFADELARTFEEQGGHVLTSTAARRIVIEGGAARGVELEVLRGPLRSRVRVRAAVVVSNSDMMDTMTRLVGREHCPRELLEGFRRLRPSCSCFITHLGLRGVSAGELAAAQGHYWDSWDADQLGRGAFAFKVFVPTLYEPAMAPPGGQVVIVQKVMEIDYETIDESGWDHHKEAIETFILARLRRLIPRLDERIVHCSSASAHTAWRFTGNHQGAMLGWEMAPDQLGAHRPLAVAPVADLHFVGAWTRPGGGINPVIVSAQRLAARLLRKAPDTVPAPA